MANLDTRLKRTSGLNPFCPWRAEYPNPSGAVTQAARQTAALAYSGILAGAFVPAIAVTLTDATNIAIANLTGLFWAWWDTPTVQTQVAPAVKGSGATTDAAGLFSVTTLAGSALSAGGIGWLEVTDSDGTVTQAPVAKVAAGPIQVS